jgi:hypothetical protein
LEDNHPITSVAIASRQRRCRASCYISREAKAAANLVADQQVAQQWSLGVTGRRGNGRSRPRARREEAVDRSPIALAPV